MATRRAAAKRAVDKSRHATAPAARAKTNRPTKVRASHLKRAPATPRQTQGKTQRLIARRVSRAARRPAVAAKLAKRQTAIRAPQTRTSLAASRRRARIKDHQTRRKGDKEKENHRQRRNQAGQHRRLINHPRARSPRRPVSNPRAHGDVPATRLAVERKTKHYTAVPPPATAANKAPMRLSRHLLRERLPRPTPPT